AAGLEEGGAEVVACRFGGGWFTGAGALVDLDQRLFLGDRYVTLLLPLAFEEVEVADEGVEEAGGVLLVEAERTQEDEDPEAALAGHAGSRGDVFARLLLDVELDPFTAVGVDGDRKSVV